MRCTYTLTLVLVSDDGQIAHIQRDGVTADQAVLDLQALAFEVLRAEAEAPEAV